MDCENCVYWQQCLEQYKDPADAERALEEMNVCEICLEDAMQE